MQNIWSVVDLLYQNPHWWYPIIFSAYGVNLDSRDVGNKFVSNWQKWYASIITTICFLPFLYVGKMINSFHSSDNSSSLQIELISLWITEQIVLTPPLINSAGIWWIPEDLCPFSFSIAISNSKVLGSGTSGSALFMFLCLTSLPPCTFKSQEKCFLHLAKILWESVFKSPSSSFTILVHQWCPYTSLWHFLSYC